MQHLALRAAAARCNMGTTQVCVLRARARALPAWCAARMLTRRAAPQFKLQCRKLGIARWPHRKLKSLNGLITSCKAASNRMRSEKLKDALTEWTAQLEAVKVRPARVRATAGGRARREARGRRSRAGEQRRARGGKPATSERRLPPLPPRWAACARNPNRPRQHALTRRAHCPPPASLPPRWTASRAPPPRRTCPRSLTASGSGT